MFRFIDDYFLPYVTFAGLTLNEFLMDCVYFRFGEYASFLVMVIALPVTISLLFAGVMITGFAGILAFILSPIILPIAIYRHIRK